MSGKTARIVLTEKQQGIPFKVTQSTTVSQRTLQRARIVMLAFERRQNEDIADGVHAITHHDCCRDRVQYTPRHRNGSDLSRSSTDQDRH